MKGGSDHQPRDAGHLEKEEKARQEVVLLGGMKSRTRV